LIVVIELSRSSWLAAARAPGVDRDPLKKLKPHPEQLPERLVRRQCSWDG
jgi:transposase